MVCLRDLDDRLTGLVKQLNDTAAANRSMDMFIIVCSDDPAMEARAKEMVEKHGGLRSCAVSIAPAQGPPGVKAPRDADCSVIFFNKRSCKAAFAFAKEEITPTSIERVIDAIEAQTATPFPLGYYAPVYTPEKAIIVNDFGADKAALGPNPAVLIFTRDTSAQVTTLVQKLEEVAKNKAAKLDNFVVLIGDAKDHDAKLKAFAVEHKLKSTTLSVEPFAKTKPFHVAKQNDITVMICAGGVARGFYTFRAEAVTAKSFDAVLADLNKIINDRIAKGL